MPRYLPDVCLIFRSSPKDELEQAESMIAQPDHSVNAMILLASASPRRRELIKLLGLPVETTSADIDEIPLLGERAAEMAIRLSRAKALAIWAFRTAEHPRGIPHCGASPWDSAFLIILASDTVVSLDGEPLGKPRVAAEARSMLQRLRGRGHQVYTAITLIDLQTDRSITDLASSDVPMRNYTDAEIETYIASDDPFDKAGAYAIQGHAGRYIPRIEGCYFNVVGLPVPLVCRMLRACGAL